MQFLRHAAAGTEDPSAFLASLRRGEAVTDAASGELLQALNALEVEYRNARATDRRVASAPTVEKSITRVPRARPLTNPFAPEAT